jgi:hypothetical protein
LIKKNSEKQAGNEKNETDDDVIVELPPFLRDLFEWLLDHHEVESSGARLKVCLLINRLLKLLGEEAEIDDELYQKIYDNMLERLKVNIFRKPLCLGPNHLDLVWEEMVWTTLLTLFIFYFRIKWLKFGLKPSVLFKGFRTPRILFVRSLKPLFSIWVAIRVPLSGDQLFVVLEQLE